MQAGTCDPVELLLVMGDARTKAAHGEARAHDNRVAQFGDDVVDFLHGMGDGGTRGFCAAAVDNLLEQFAILTTVNGLERGADEFDIVFLEDSSLAERDRGVQRGLAAQCRQQGVGAFLGDDLLKDRGGDRLDVGGIGHLRIGHNGRRVGVDEDDPDAFFAQHAARLGAGIVEFCGLPDDNRAGADDHDGFDIGALRHWRFPPWRNA